MIECAWPPSRRDERPAARITGLGAVTPVGVGVRSYTHALRAGRSGVRALPFTHPRVRARVAADVPESVFDPRSVLDEAELRRVPRLVPMAIAAAREALTDAGLDVWLAGHASRSRRVGVVLGTGGGGIDFTLDQFRGEAEGRTPSLWTITNATHGNLAGELSIALGLRGPSYCVSTGCASSSDAAGMALGLLRDAAGRVRAGDPDALDALVVVGADAHVRWETLSTMELLRVISTREPALDAGGDGAGSISRPFDLERDGFVLGEGAWAVVLERAGARPDQPDNGLLAGYGATCDAFHRVRPDPDMGESARAIRMALRDAGAGVEDVSIVHYHGTSTRVNDALETRAIRLALGDAHAQRVHGTSCKSMIGHPQGACGLAALVATVASLLGRDGGGPFVPPTINLCTTDPACDLDYTPLRARPLDPGPRLALVNCLAFGAKNSALAVRIDARRSGLPAPV